MEHKVIRLPGFDYAEIDKIMRAVKPQFEKPRDLIFAKTTPNSLKMRVEALIEDLAGDHEYLKNNPPQIPRKTDGG